MLLDDPAIERLAAGVPHLSYDEIIGHPGFAAARKVHLDRFLELYDNDPFLVRLLVEAGRFFVYRISIALEVSQDPDDPGTWFTTRRLRQKMASFGMRSERHVDHLVNRLREVGFLEVQRCSRDRRLRILKVTEKMLAHDRAWLAAHYAPLAFLFPQRNYGAAIGADPAFHVAHRRLGKAFLPLTARILEATPAVRLFFDRVAGLAVLSALLRAAISEPDQPPPTVRYADIADRFGVSRTHVRKMFVDAEAAGLVRLQAPGGHRVEVLPSLWCSYDRSIAANMFVQDLLYAVATGRSTRP